MTGVIFPWDAVLVVLSIGEGVEGDLNCFRGSGPPILSQLRERFRDGSPAGREACRASCSSGCCNKLFRDSNPSDRTVRQVYLSGRDGEMPGFPWLGNGVIPAKISFDS